MLRVIMRVIRFSIRCSDVMFSPQVLSSFGIPTALFCKSSSKLCASWRQAVEICGTNTAKVTGGGLDQYEAETKLMQILCNHPRIIQTRSLSDVKVSNCIFVAAPSHLVSGVLTSQFLTFEA